MAGPAQRWDPARYRRNASFVPALGRAVLELLAPGPGERILDLGCGDGALSIELMAAGADVVGIDASPEQVAAAQARGVDAHVVAGAGMGFEGEFDAVFSNAALHWMKPPEPVIRAVYRALKPGGRFVAEMGGSGNVVTVERALHHALGGLGIDAGALSPWYFPGPPEYGGKLVDAGFRVRAINLIDRPTPLPGPLGDWLWTFAETFLTAVPEDRRSAVIDAVTAACAPALQGAGGAWSVDYVRLRFAADKPATEA